MHRSSILTFINDQHNLFNFIFDHTSTINGHNLSMFAIQILCQDKSKPNIISIFWIIILDMIEGVAPNSMICISCSNCISFISAQKIYILACQFLCYDAICINHVLCDFEEKIWLCLNKNDVKYNRNVLAGYIITIQ